MPNGPANGSTRALVVDDERFFREAIRELLEADGIGCRLAANAAEAIEGAADPAVGVVVLDIQLPDKSGLDVLRALRERRPELRVVMLSAHTDQEYVLEALRLGACDYLAKPLHEEEVRLSVRRALDSHALAASWSALRGRLGALAGEVEQLLGDGADRESLPARLAEAAGRLLDANKTSVLLREPAGDQLRVVAVTGRKLLPEELDRVPIGGGVAGQAVARGEALLVEDASADPRFASAASERYESSSFVVMPLGVGPERFGALCATDRRGGARFGEEDVALLRLLGLALAPLLDPTRPLLGEGGASSLELGELLEYPAQAAEGVRGSSGRVAAQHADGEPSPGDLDAALARAVCDAMTAELEPDRVLASALRAIAESLSATPVSVYLFDAASQALRREAQWNAGGAGDREVLPRDAGLSGAVFASGQALASEEPAGDARFDAAVDTPQSGASGPLLVLPLRFRGKTLGIFRAFAPRAGATSPRTQEVLGAALSAAVRNALLYRSLVESIEEVAQVRRESAPSE
jgi:DNA-binding response OmpR family regulator